MDLIEGTGSTSQREMQIISDTVSAEGLSHNSGNMRTSIPLNNQSDIILIADYGMQRGAAVAELLIIEEQQ